ncbi:MAG: hypothetical protein RBT74_09890 [Tenuifilaceae bacterium]|nr:hypothetical protein [Tenuifilaceae bacterium]
MRLIFRSLTILGILTLVSLFYGCPGCEFDFPISINKMEIKLLDNSGEKPQITESEFQSRTAIAFTCQLFDSIYYYPYDYAYQSHAAFSIFQSAQAWSCVENYTLENKVTDIKIKTIHDISANVKANDDVTHLFVAELPETHQEYLYFTIDQIIERVNSNATFWNPWVSLYLFFTIELEHDSACFDVQITLDSGEILHSVTPIIFAQN